MPLPLSCMCMPSASSALYALPQLTTACCDLLSAGTMCTMGMRMAENVLNNLDKPVLLALTARWILKLYGRRQACSSYQCRPLAC